MFVRRGQLWIAPLDGTPTQLFQARGSGNAPVWSPDASRIAFTSTRVMATCSVMGQAAGTAAAFCSRYKIAPRQLYEDKTKLRELQQTLLRDDQSISGRKNEDPADLARKAKASASAEHEDAKAEHVINGYVRDMSGEWTNRWSAPLDGGPAWLQLAWDKPQRTGA